jgi:hypothetical protein
VYKHPDTGRYWLCRSRWIGEKCVHEHATMIGQRVKWFRHPPGWTMPVEMALEREAAIVVMSVLAVERAKRQARSKRKRRV